VEENLYAIAIGELVVSADPNDVLVAYGLGSCVTISLYDPQTRVGGMLHALLPQPQGSRHGENIPARFVEQGVPLLLQEVLHRGARRQRLQAVLCGGAQMMSGSVLDGQLHIGRHNVLAATAALERLNIPLQARDTGGRRGRTVRFYIASGQVTVRTLLQERILLTSA